jgi:hypothetical protein
MNATTHYHEHTTAPQATRGVSPTLLAFLGSALVASAAAAVALLKPYKPGEGVGYFMGLAGGIMMLLLLLYPLRKNVKALHRLGPMRPWFSAHMVLGIFGPVLVIFHTTLKLSSANASVAFLCMVLVAASGVAGRFWYRRIHHGLTGRKASLGDMEEKIAQSRRGLGPLLKAVPSIESELRAFRGYALLPGLGGWRRIEHFLTLSQHMRRVEERCAAGIARAVAQHVERRGLGRDDIPRRMLRGRALVREYLHAVREAAQFSTYERLFSLWHVLHIPFVYLLIGSSVYHVIAVHMY